MCLDILYLFINLVFYEESLSIVLLLPVRQKVSQHPVNLAQCLYLATPYFERQY